MSSLIFPLCQFTTFTNQMMQHNPRHKDVAIELYLSELEEQLMNTSAKGNKYRNFNREEGRVKQLTVLSRTEQSLSRRPTMVRV